MKINLEANSKSHIRSKSHELFDRFANQFKDINVILESESEQNSKSDARNFFAKNLKIELNFQKENEKEEEEKEEEREGKNDNQAKKNLQKFELQNLDTINYLDDGYEQLAKELEYLKNSLLLKTNESEKKDKESELLKENLSVYNNEIINKSNEIEALKETLKDKEDYIKELKQNIEEQAKNYQNMLKSKEIEIKRLKEKCEQFLYLNEKITNEKYIINSENSELRIGINGLKYKNGELERCLQSERNKTKISLNSIEKKECEIQSLINKFS